jgi:3-hydroxyacyl-[acyl-carrier-protein] dehydratase
VIEHGDIKKVLPHRHPVLLVDRVLEVEPGERIVTVKAVSGSEPCFAGLPDDAPAEAYDFPASLLVESFGQSGALLWLHTMQAGDGVPPGTLIFAQARDCVLEGAARPGDLLRHEVRIENLKPNNVFLTGETYVGDRRIATMGSAMAVIRETDSLAPAPPGQPTGADQPASRPAPASDRPAASAAAGNPTGDTA